MIFYYSNRFNFKNNDQYRTMNKYNPYNIVDKSWNKYLPFVKFGLIGETNVAISYIIFY